MGLTLHLFLHVLTALLAGFISWLLFGDPLASFVGGILGGVLIDLDHLIDYFLAFKWQWKLAYFLKGYQFLKSDKVYVLFHGWEYVVFLGLVVLIVDMNAGVRVGLFALGLGALFHLIVDTFVNHGMTFRGYSFFYRLQRGFDVEKIVTPEHYRKHVLQRNRIDF